MMPNKTEITSGSQHLKKTMHAMINKAKTNLK